MIDLNKHPHGYSLSEVLSELNSSPDGLSQKEAANRLKQHGPNELPKGKSIRPILLFVKQFKSWLVIILIIAAIISYLAGEHIDTWVITSVVFINAFIGFYQELRAEKAITALQTMIVHMAKVIRSGEVHSVRTKELVPGDIIVLEEGDSIPADARIIEAKSFRTIESSLTGESVPVAKKQTTLNNSTPMGDRCNMAWKSTFVAAGYARAVVTGTGVNTAIGDISESLGSIHTSRSNFIKKTDTLARQMSIIAIGSALVIFLIGYFIRNFETEEILLTSIAALVAAVPEGLPAVISIVLAIGANRMSRKKAIIRELTATETLGAVSAILTDKTGTLTQNTLTVRKAFLPGEPEISVTGEGWFPAGNFLQDDTIIEPESNPQLKILLRIAGICNNSEIIAESDDTYKLIGDPTEGALLSLSKKGGIDPSSFSKHKLDDIPFNSDKKFRSTLVDLNNKELYMTGAPEVILSRSTNVLTREGVVSLDEQTRNEIARQLDHWSHQAMRVIALAYKPAGDCNCIEDCEFDQLVFVGLVGMIDPPRTDAREAVSKCKQAGIRVMMVTGDHVNTAVAVAREIGLIEGNAAVKTVALTQQQLERLDDKEFDEALKRVSVFARLTPQMKLRIAERLQSMGELIAMTGDGVNDAPALKKADVGISMGIMGTDVARDVSDIVLADDNFATIINAIEEGRIVFNNARKTSFFLVTTNLAESLVLILAIALGLPIPLTATQILWLNLVTDGVTDMALATERGHGDIMKKKTVDHRENILNRKVIPLLIINVFVMVGLSLGMFYYYSDQGPATARTGIFVVMAFTQLFNVFNLRSLEISVFKIGMFSNRYVNIAVAVSALLVVLITEYRLVADIFHFGDLPLIDFGVLFILSSSVLWMGEIYKSLSEK